MSPDSLRSMTDTLDVFVDLMAQALYRLDQVPPDERNANRFLEILHSLVRDYRATHPTDSVSPNVSAEALEGFFLLLQRNYQEFQENPEPNRLQRLWTRLSRRPRGPFRHF